MKKRYDRTLPKKWAKVALVFTALGDEHRQRILMLFGPREEMSIKEIVDASPLSRTAVSHHLRTLREAGVLRSEKRQKQVFLKPDPATVREALDAVRDYVEAEW